MFVCRYYFEDIVLSDGAALASQHHHQVHAAHAQHVPPAVHAGLDHKMGQYVRISEACHSQ